jgi:serine/threonine-protein kinase
MPYCPTCNGRFPDGTFCPKDGTALLPEGEAARSLVGQVIDKRYRLTKLLGAGGMGEVYIGEHVHITKKVAVKLLHPEISNNPEALIRFQQEAQSASKIGHDNIVRIDDFGKMDDGRVYLCMEFLEGESLSAAMQAPGLDHARALDIMIQVSDGLGAAHAKGIIHRDMKPENVFLVLRSDGTELAKILDFGIAKVKGTDQNESLTRTGTVFGTPHYMSPEQALGQKLDHRADIYSVGVMLFEIFTGQVPFKAESFMGILSQHITKPAPRPSTFTPGRVIPKPIEDIILKAMAKEPDKRFANMKEMADALRAVRAGIAPSLAAAPRVTGSGRAAQVAPAGGAVGYQPTMASVPPGAAPAQAVGYQATMASVPPGAAPGAPVPRTMVASAEQQAQYVPPPDVPVVASPVPVAPVIPSPSPRPQKKKSYTGLIVAIVSVVVLLGGSAIAAAIFWEKIFPPQGTAGAGEGTGTGTVATGTGAGTGSGMAVAPKPDLTKVALVDPKKVEPKDEPKVEPKDEPKVEPKGKKGKKKKGKVTVEPKDEPKVEPKVAKIAKVVPKDCCRVRISTVPEGASVIVGGLKKGETPWVTKLPPGGQLTIKLAKGGHQEKTVTITASDNETKKFTLTRMKGPGFKMPGADPGVGGGDPFGR